MKNNRRRFLKQIAGSLGIAACAKYLTACTPAKAADTDDADLSLANSSPPIAFRECLSMRHFLMK